VSFLVGLAGHVADDVAIVAMATTPVSEFSIRLRLVGVAALWGGTFIAGRVLAETIPPMLAAAGRYAIACALLILLARIAEGGLPKLDRRQMLVTLLLGLTGIFAYNVFFFSALAHMPAGRTALLVALNPVLTAVVLAVFLGERLGVRRWLGICVALIGTAIVITRGDAMAALSDLSRTVGVGELMMLGAVFSFVTYGVVGRLALAGLTPIAATTYAALWGLLFLAVGATFELQKFDASAVALSDLAALLYLGAFGTVIAFVWYYAGIRAIGASRTAVFINLVPLFGVLLGALLLGETVSISMIVGGAIAIAGVMMTSR
jgi:drug/metabolite transporter (DMT)-like permease